ncbi:hypothetical protein FRC02_006049 [Tulasnella sp. 418]|nr:hypothetical protein FRC02_006049 [Tulasnella sp. 418]
MAENYSTWIQSLVGPRRDVAGPANRSHSLSVTDANHSLLQSQLKSQIVHALHLFLFPHLLQTTCMRHSDPSPPIINYATYSSRSICQHIRQYRSTSSITADLE